MNNLYPTEGGHTSDEDRPMSQLTIYAVPDGTIYFACDWESDNTQSIHALGSIFYKLGHSDLLEEILRDLKPQCVLENKEREFQQLVETISLFVESKTQNESENSVTISPRNVIRL